MNEDLLAPVHIIIEIAPEHWIRGTVVVFLVGEVGIRMFWLATIFI